MSVHTIEELSPTRRKFKITVPAADVRKSWDKVLEEVRSTAEVRGFRKGKAPVSLIKNVYAGDIAKKVINTLVNDSYNKALKESELQVLNQPNIEPNGQFSEAEDFSYTAVVDIYNKVEIKDYKGLNLTLPENLSDKAEDEEFEKALKAENERLEKIKEAKAEKSDESSESKEGDEKAQAEISQSNKDFLKKQVGSYFKSLRAQSAYMQVIDQLLEKNAFEVADILVEQMIDQLIYSAEVVQGQKDPKTVPMKDKAFRDTYREKAEKQVKAVMALTHIAQQEKIEVPSDELFQSVSRFLEQNRLNFQQIRDNQNAILQEHKSEILLLKATEFIIDNANITWEPMKEEAKEAKTEGASAEPAPES